MLHGVELAERIAKHIVDVKAAERALVLQMPGWTSRTSSTPAAVAVLRGSYFHILGAVDTWSITMAPPPALGRFSKLVRWSDQGPNLPEASELLADLSRHWWAEVPDAVGAIDVLGSITHAIEAALGAARGTFGNMVNAESGRGEAERLARGWVGRNGQSPRWPSLADVFAGADGIAVTLTTANGAREQSQLQTVNELAAALPGIVDILRATDDASAAWLVRLESLANFTERLRSGLRSEWTTTGPFEIALDEEPLVSLAGAAPIGGQVHVLTTPFERGLRVSVGKERIDIPDATTIGRALERVLLAIDVESRVLRASRLVPKERYRVIRAFDRANAGDELIFREVAEVRPSGADVWFFAREGAHAISVSLSSDDAGDVAILDSLEDYLALA